MFLVSEREIRRDRFKLFNLRLAGCFMNGISINEYRLERFCRACIFTGSATDTNLILHFRNEQSTLKWDHMTGFGWTVFRAGTACSLLSIDYTVVPDEDCLTQLCQFLCFNHKWHDGSCGAYVCAKGTFIVTEASVEIHPWLHDAGEPVLAD